MHKPLLILAAVAILTSCGKPSTPAKPPEAAPSTSACNQVTPNLAIPAMMRGASVPASSLPALSDGPIAAGLYDLASGEQFDGAPSWEDTRSVSLKVSNGPAATTFEWAELAGPNQSTRSNWTAEVKPGTPATLTFTCGRTGAIPIGYTSSGRELQLRMADPSGTGTLDLAFITHQP
jgi:hypothetical protein